jgi:hypothetical protein
MDVIGEDGHLFIPRKERETGITLHFGSIWRRYRRILPLGIGWALK